MSSRRSDRSKTSKVEPKESPPKKPLVAFFQFRKEVFADLKAKNPEMKISQISVTIGKMWKELSDDKKKPYVDLYNKDHEEYLKKKDEYLAKYGAPKKESRSKAKKVVVQVQQPLKKVTGRPRKMKKDE